ncbi:hypothetical protein N9D63_07290 [Opitutales bacterium]|nr:hypothetical protein [Opitutales bacterium]
MKLKLLSIFLVAAMSGLSAGCTLSEIGQKTKSGFKKALGIDGNSTTDSATPKAESNSSAEEKATP